MAVSVDPGLIWTKKCLRVRFANQLPDDQLTLLSQQDAERVFFRAAEQWSREAEIVFSGSDDPDAEIVVRWGRPEEGADVLGQTEPPGGDNRPISLVIAEPALWSAADVLLTPDTLHAALLHQIGHALGMEHSANADAVMYRRPAPPFFSRTTLSPDDIDGLRFLYANARKPIMIVNETGTYASWYVYNSNDPLSWVTLRSGALAPGEMSFYDPDANGAGPYFIRFTRNGGATELAAGLVPRDSLISLLSDTGHDYRVDIAASMDG